MRKGILNRIIFVGFVVSAILLWVNIIVVASDKVPKYWQDIILKPEQAWIEAYGYNNESILAYNVRSLILIAKQQEEVITALKKELDALSEPKEIEDPNEVKE